MSALIGSLAELFAVLAQSFSLSAVFPSFVFVLLNYLFVRPLVLDTWLYGWFPVLDATGQSIILAVLVIGFAYLLSAGNVSIIRLFEGYPLQKWFPFDSMRQLNLNTLRDINSDVYTLKAEIERLEKQKLDLPYRDRLPFIQQQERLRMELNDLIRKQLFHFPQSERRVLPMPLGNIIAAAEEYPRLLFGMDSVSLWPYLMPTLTEQGYAKFIEYEKAIFDLLLNGTFLVALFGIELGIFEFLIAGPSFKLAAELLVVGVAILVLYLFALQGATGWGVTIRAAFVLYREKLRETLGLVKPVSYKNECDIWEATSKFLQDPAQASLVGQGTSFLSYESSQPKHQLPIRKPRKGRH